MRSGWFAPAVLIGILCALCSSLLAVAPAQEDPPPAVGAGSVPAQESRSSTDVLRRIRDFRIGVPDDGEASSLTEIVNLFPARKRRRVHGSVYEYHRNDNLDARNFFDPLGEPLPEFKRNQFGFNLGTSFFKDRLSTLVSYDGLRIVQGSTLLSHVPTPDQKRGDFSVSGITIRDPLTGQPFVGNRIPEERIDPIARGLLGVLPDPNRLGDPDRNFVNNQPYVTDVDAWEFRVDYQIDERNKLFWRLEWRDESAVSVDSLPSFGRNRAEANREVEISYTRNFSPRLVLDAELQFERRSNGQRSFNSGRDGLLASVGIGGLTVRDSADEGYPEFDISGYASFGDTRSPEGGVDNEWQPEVTLTWALDSHTLRFGSGSSIEQTNNQTSGNLVRGEFAFDGSFTGDGFADFLLGIPKSAARATGSDRVDLRSRNWFAWASEDWRVSSGFTLSVGLTYFYRQPWRSVRDNVSSFYPLLFEPPLDGEIVLAGSPRAVELGLSEPGSRTLVRPYRNNWEPRVGFAFSPGGNRRLVIRSSYSVNYDPVNKGRYIQGLGRNFPVYFTESAESSNDTPELDLNNPFEAVVPAALTFHGIEPNIRNSRTQNWNFTLQNEIVPRWNLEFRYNGSKSDHLLRTIPANVPLPGPGPIQQRRPNPDFGLFTIHTGGGAASRHAFTALLDRRFSDGFSLRSEFVWSRSISDTFGGDPSNPRDLRAERALNNGPTKSFSLNYIWDLPFGEGKRWLSANPLKSVLGGWRLSGITRIQSGHPFTVRLSGDFNNDGLSNDRPDRIDGAREGFSGGVDEWFDTSAFELPASEFGNSGRNILYGPPRTVWDMSLSKSVRMSDSDSLEIRVEFFNAFNQVNFHNPENEFGTSVFGAIFGADRAREIEIALKYSF